MSAGIPIVMRDPMLRFLAAAYISNAAAVTALQAVLVVAAAQRFGHDADVGWLYAAVGAGSLLGTLPVIRRTPGRVNTLPIAIATAVELAPLALFVFATALPVAIVLLFASGLGADLYQTRGVIGVQQRVPRELLGRTMAVIRSAAVHRHAARCHRRGRARSAARLGGNGAHRVRGRRGLPLLHRSQREPHLQRLTRFPRVKHSSAGSKNLCSFQKAGVNH